MILEIFRFLHILGLAFGLGGATLAAIISRKADKDLELGKQIMKIMSSVSKLIWLGLILLIISGIGISFYIEWPINKNLLIVKHVLVAWIVIFGVFIGVKMKRMKPLAPIKPNEKPSSQFVKAKKQLKFFSIINLILWYIITLMSVFL